MNIEIELLMVVLLVLLITYDVLFLVEPFVSDIFQMVRTQKGVFPDSMTLFWALQEAKV